MSSTFFGLSIGASGLNAFHAAVNTTANNISNIQTEGYSKQVVNLEAANSLRTYQRYGTTGTGVLAKSVTQMRDEYYDTKYWSNQSKYGEYDKKYYYMQQIENYFTDDENVEGFTRLYSKMFNALDSVKNNPADTSKRNEFISDAKEVLTYFNTMSNQLSDLQSTINDEIKSTVGNINSIVDKITSLNKQINVIEMEGGHANELRDARNLLVDELSEIIPIEINETQVINTHYADQYTGATLYTVKFNGRLLVDTYNNNKLDTEVRSGRDNQSDVDGLYEVVWSDSGDKVDMNGYNMTGSLKALFQIRDGNNEDNLTGTVTDATTTSITVTSPSITDITKMNMPEEGRITANSTIYEYNGFTFETDEDGNVTSYTFQLKQPINSDVVAILPGQKAENGDGIDYKGIPYYQTQMNTFLRSFAKMFNDVESTGAYQYDASLDTDGDGKIDSVGYDYNGDPMRSFFIATDPSGNELDFVSADRATNSDIEFRGTNKNKACRDEREVVVGKDEDGKDIYGSDHSLSSSGNNYYRLTAANIDIAKDIQNDPKLFATTTTSKTNPDGIDASDLVNTLKKLESDVTVFRGTGGKGFLECIYSDVTVDTMQCKVFSQNFESIKTTIDNQRQSISGVDEDEEALDLVKFQNAYNLSSKLISVLNEMYDRLISGTGV